MLLLGDAQFREDLGRALRVLSAENDHLVRLADLLAHTRVLWAPKSPALGATRHVESKASANRLFDEEFAKISVVVEIETDEDVRATHG